MKVNLQLMCQSLAKHGNLLQEKIMSVKHYTKLLVFIWLAFLHFYLVGLGVNNLIGHHYQIILLSLSITISISLYCNYFKHPLSFPLSYSLYPS